MLNRWQSTIVDGKGDVQPGAVLTIRNESDQSLAQVYASPGTSQPYPLGTVAADASGYAYFYAPAGLYRIQSFELSIDWRHVDIGAAVATGIAQQALDNALPTYETLADMQADTGKPVDTMGRVVNDPAGGTNGFYLWNGTQWSRTSLQPLSGMDASIEPEAGKIPLAGASGTIKQAWVHELELALDKLRVATNKALYGDGPYPVLDFQFQGAKMLDPRITFTRATPDWDWDGKRYEVNEPILSDDGLWLWSARTNRLTHSWDFSNAAWQKSDGATAEDKDGYFTVSHGGTGTAYTIRTAITAGSGVVFSTGVRAFVGFRIRMGAADTHTVHFDEDMNVVSKGSSVTSVKVVPLGAFSRIELAFDAVPQGYVTFSPVDYEYAGAVLDIKYTQLEIGSVATPHIPTSGAQVTVGASTLEVLGDAFKGAFNPFEGALLFASGENHRGVAAGASPFVHVGILGVGNNGQLAVGDNTFNYRPSTTGTQYLRIPNIPASPPYMSPDGYTIGFSYKNSAFVGAHKDDIATASWNYTDFTASGASRLYVSPLTHGYVRSLSYYDRALSDEQLKELTR